MVTPTGRLRAAIVGFGGMGQRHYRAYQGSSCDVVAACDVQPDRVLEHAPEIPGDRVFGDYRRLLAVVPDLQLVSVVSNGPTHAEIAMAAMRSGVGRVLLEKPVATSLADARAVEACAQETGARVTINHVRRWSADYLRLRRLLADGLIGRLRHITFTSGSTGLGNFVTHAFDTMRWLFDSEPVTATGWIDRTGTPNPRGLSFRDPGGFGVVVFDSGQRGFIDASEDTGMQYLFTLVGEYGRVVVDELNNRWTIQTRTAETRSLPFTRYGAETERVPFEPSEPYDLVTLTRRAIEELAGDGPISCTCADGRRSLELVVAFHESDAAGHIPLTLPLDGAALGREVRIA